jgi:hypothetical protein
MPALQPPEIWQQSRAATRPPPRCSTTSTTGPSKEWVLRPDGTRRSSPRWPRPRSAPTASCPRISTRSRSSSGTRSAPFRPDAGQGVHHEGRLQLRRVRRAAMDELPAACTTPTGASSRCGLQAFPVEADTGVIGGKYLARVHGARPRRGRTRWSTANPAATRPTSRRPPAAARHAHSDRGPPVPRPRRSPRPAWSPSRHCRAGALPRAWPPTQIKTLVFVAESKPVIVLMRGDDQLNEAKLSAASRLRPVPPRHPRRDRRPAGRASRQPGRGGPPSRPASASTPTCCCRARAA